MIVLRAADVPPDLAKFFEPLNEGAQTNILKINPRPYPGSHYATFPPDLVYPMVKASTSESGVCAECNAPRERVVERPKPERNGEVLPSKRDGGMTAEDGLERVGMSHFKYNEWLKDNPTRTVGWQQSCSCEGADVVPATVLDPFAGSGTTLLTSRTLGRRSVGFDLDSRNVRLIDERLGYQGVLL